MTADINRLLSTYNQEHISSHLDLMTDTERQALLRDIEQIDFEQTAGLYESYRLKLNAGEKKKVYAPALAEYPSLYVCRHAQAG